MKNNFIIILLPSLAMIQGKDDADLPICPTNIEFFPQNLPMHCRMPRSVDLSNGIPKIPTVMPPLPPGFQSPPPDGQPAPIPVPFPGGGLGMPGQLPGQMPGPMGGSMPMPMNMPGPMLGPMPGPMPGSMPMVSMGGPNHKLPVIVMPFYSPDTGYKKKPDERPRFPPKKRRRRPKRPLYKDSSTDTDTDTDTDDSDTDTSDTDTDTSSDTSSDHETWKGLKKGWKKNARRMKSRRRSGNKRRYKKKKELLTPVLQYVTKDGYVIFEKKISKGEASDWLKADGSKPENQNDKESQDNNDRNNQHNERNDNNEGNDNNERNANENEDDKKAVETTTLPPRIRPKRHRQYHHDGHVKLNYEQI